jgi:nucleotide-binding universal stress UspA family protein
MRILIPIDGTARSLAAVDFVASRKGLVGRDPDVFVLHAQWPAPRNIVKVVGHGHLRTVQDRSAERVLKPALKTLAAAELVTQSISVIGHAGQEIARAAKKQRADLIVMASRGLSATRERDRGVCAFAPPRCARDGLAWPRRLRFGPPRFRATRVAALCRTPLLLIRRP